MSSVVKPLHQLIVQLSTCQERLEPYKMTQKQISEIFAWLDHRRRGYIDVSDFYTKFPELTENQLFYVFKFLDISRKGAFKLQDIQTALCIKSGCNRDPQDDSIRSFTNLVRVLKATFHLVQQQRKKCHLTSSTLEQIFNRACQNKKDKIDITDLVILLKEASLQVNEKILVYIKNKIFYKSSLTLKQFTQAFSQYFWNEDYGMTDTNVKHMLQQKIESTGAYLQNRTTQKIKNTEKINSQIDKILQKYRKPTHTSTVELTQIPQRKQEIEQGTIDLESYLSKTQNRYQSRFLQDVQNSQINMKSIPRQVQREYLREIPREYARQAPREYTREAPRQAPRQYTREIPRDYNRQSPTRQLRSDHLRATSQAEQNRYQKILSNTSNVNPTYSPISNSQSYSEISRRREELRKGSLQRQKIIDDLMNKKKSEYSSSINKPGMLYSHNLKIQTKFSEPQATFLSGHSYVHNRSATPTSKMSEPKINYDNSFIGKLYQNTTVQKQVPFRPASATKASNFYDKAYYNKFDHNSRPDLMQFYRKGSQTKNTQQDKQNILKKAEQQATKKIQEIQRRAKLKVMEKRSTAGVYNRWLK